MRPFVTSAIAVGAQAIHLQTEMAFREIAAAGGGAYASLLITMGGESDSEASARIVHHVMTLAFGVQFAAQIEAFVDVYLEYHRAGFFD